MPKNLFENIKSIRESVIKESEIEEDSTQALDDTNEYAAEVPVMISMDGADTYEYSDAKALIKYKMIIEKRIWGIKDIKIADILPISFRAEVFDTATGNSRGLKDFTIDTKVFAVNIDYVNQGTTIRPLRLWVYVDEKENVKTAELEFNFTTKE